MPPPRKDSLDTAPAPLGIIAGGGALPYRLLAACDAAGRDVFLVGFEGQTDPALMQGRSYMMTRLGAAGKIIETLRTHGVRDLVLIGSIRRPGLAQIRPDWRAARFFARIGLRALGDDGLLKALRAELEAEGFSIRGVQDFVDGLLMREGPLGRLTPKAQDRSDIERGIAVSQTLGRMDVGQAAIVREGIVLGIEAAEGTDELIRRCGAYGERAGRGGVLVKTCKPQQDRDLDLPTIGPQTVRLCAAAGLSGIAAQAGAVLLLDAEETARAADEAGLFVTGVAVEAS